VTPGNWQKNAGGGEGEMILTAARSALRENRRGESRILNSFGRPEGGSDGAFSEAKPQLGIVRLV
jgi:hypothetical protein